ncbi:MAG TPA: tetratricopeptide repeat protein, partial [Arcobacter sp.]|nr:tetratricopeptide repeat protein [Arcobacter sp.]
MENLSTSLSSKDSLKLDQLNKIISYNSKDEQSLLIISCDTLELNSKFEEYLNVNINNLTKIDNIQDGLFKQILSKKENFKDKYILINLFSIEEYKAIREEFQFKRDYIPQEKLKFIFLLNIEQYESFKTKAYDFFSFNDFFHNFTDVTFSEDNYTPDLSKLTNMIDEYEKIKNTNISKQSRMKYLNDIGYKAYHFSKYKVSLEYQEEALFFAKKNKDFYNIAWITHAIGNIFERYSSYKLSLKYQKESLRLFKKI